MPPQSMKIDHLPSDASAILRERYLAGTFSVVTQWTLLQSLPSYSAGNGLILSCSKPVTYVINGYPQVKMG